MQTDLLLYIKPICLNLFQHTQMNTNIINSLSRQLLLSSILVLTSGSGHTLQGIKTQGNSQSLIPIRETLPNGLLSAMDWGWGFAGRNGGGVGCRVSETTKPAFSTMPPCPVVSPALQLLPTVANQIKSLQDNSLIPCQTKVCKPTTKKLGRC